VLLTCLLPFLATERSRVLEKKVNETQVSKTVFSHLNGVISYRSDYGEFVKKLIENAWYGPEKKYRDTLTQM